MISRSLQVLIVGAALVALMVLFPPWYYFDNNSSGSAPAGYHFILTPPDPATSDFIKEVVFPEAVSARKNLLRLNIQLLITIPTTLGLAILLRKKRSVITIIIGILFFLPPLLVIGLVTWLVIDGGLHYGNWSLP